MSQIPSTATTGFFQERPRLANALDDDWALGRAINLLLPSNTQQDVVRDLSRWADVCISPQVKEWIHDAETNLPSLQLRDTFGCPSNKLITSNGWRQLQNLGLREGAVATGYEDRYGVHTRLVQFLRLLLWVPSSSMVTCPSAMQDGAASLLRRHIASKDISEETRQVYRSAYKHLTSREIGIAWTSGQWMTERPGGSDVSQTETRARLASQEELNELSDYVANDARGSRLGPWAIDGFKWFSSATDADTTVLLAKTPGSDKLSCFLAPTRIQLRGASRRTVVGHYDPRANTMFNGIYPQRLKNKLGGKALPTAELELKGMRGYLIGKEGQGVKEISTVLTLTRIHNANSAMGYLGRGLAVARAYARVRKLGDGRLLKDVPAHVKTLAHWHVQYHAHLLLSLFVTNCLGLSESSGQESKYSTLLQSRSQAEHLLRLLNPVSKALTALTAVAGLRACMECMGGIGYLENDDVELNLARIFRDANVLPIWEGTTNIMAADVLRVLKGRTGANVMQELRAWIEGIARTSSVSLKTVLEELAGLEKAVRELSLDELLYDSVQHLETLGWVAMATLLASDASRDRDDRATDVFMRFMATRDSEASAALTQRSWEQGARADARIVFSRSRFGSTRPQSRI